MAKGILTSYPSDPKLRAIKADIGVDSASPSFPLFARVYKLLCTKGQMDAAFERLRTFAQSVACALNSYDWSPYCSVTDDFVIYPQNGTDYYCGTEEDIAKSIPVDKQNLLRSRGLIR